MSEICFLLKTYGPQEESALVQRGSQGDLLLIAFCRSSPTHRATRTAAVHRGMGLPFSRALPVPLPSGAPTSPCAPANLAAYGGPYSQGGP